MDATNYLQVFPSERSDGSATGGSLLCLCPSFFENYPDASSIYHNRVELTVNGVRVALMQTPIGNQADYGTESSGAVVKLNTGGPHRLEDYVRKFHLVNRRSYLLWRL